MSWTAPMTAVSGNAFTASQFNIHVRDNLLETAPGLATTAGGYFAATRLNNIEQRIPGTAEVLTTQTTTSTSFTDLATVGPAVTIDTGTSALVCIESQLTTADAGTSFAIASYTVSGATTTSAADDRSINEQGGSVGSQNFRYGTCFLVSNLTPGTNIFTMKYRTTNASFAAAFLNRRISVIPF